jgi:transitional endoplasmic reticulum ATPase
MWQTVSGAMERTAHFVGYWILALAGISWSAIAATQWLVHQEPLLYRIAPVPSAESYPVLAACIVLGVNAAYCTLKAAIKGKPEVALTLPWLAARVFWVSFVAVALWILSGPAPGASYLLPVGVVVLSAWCWYVSERGYLSLPRYRARQGSPNPDGAEPSSPARVTKPKLTFASIHGNEAIKARLKDAARAITTKRKDDARPRNGILLHGLPGNGKTVFAEALAGELGLPLVTLSYADVASQWVGEKSARVRAVFEQARRQQPCVLFVDEVDSFLEARDRSDGVKEDRDLVNAMLTLMVDIRQSRVILIAATNRMDRLDDAGVREGRFDFKVEITPPDMAARVGLLKKGMNDNLPSLRADDPVIQSVAQRWNGFSVKRLLAVTEELPAYLKANGAGSAQSVDFDDFMGALRQLQGQRGHVPENVKPLEDLVFSENTREMLDMIVGRMADPEHTERHGGTLPTGVLFHGPPGTGKTAACKAVAKKIGWTCLPATGADLARDPKRLEALYAKAQDLRPAIIFIDEADELLRDRQYSSATEATHKLLTLMDGVGDRARDVVWIAATNHPEQIDSALLRGGRFTEKVEFEIPSDEDLGRYIERWLEQKKVVLDALVDLRHIAEVVGRSSIAHVEAVLQAAVNRAVARRQVPVTVRLTDFEWAAGAVMGSQVD